MYNHNNLINKNLKINIFYGSFFFIICSLFTLLFLNICRLGLETPFKLNSIIVILIFNIGLSPFLINYEKYRENNDIIFIKISFAILFSFFFILCGFFFSKIYFVITTFLIILSIIKLKDIVQYISFKLLLVLFILSSLFIVNYIPWKIEYIFSPEITLFGLGGNQTMQGAALTNIIKNYRAVSLGGDGTEHFLYKYHYGTYLWWASLSIISNAKPLILIPFVQLGLFVPMIFFATYISVNSFISKNYKPELLFFCILFFIIFDAISGKLHYDSETYTLSLVVLILLLPLLRYTLNSQKHFFTIILILFIPILSSLKLSTGFLYCVLLGLIFLYNRKMKINYFYFFVSAFFGIISLKLFMPTSYTDLGLWRLYSSYNQILSYQTLICIILPSLYMLNIFFKFKYSSAIFNIKLRKSQNKIKKLFRWLINSKLSFPKLIIISTFFSVLPVFALPVGATGIYNIIHLHWVFLIFFIAKINNHGLMRNNLKKLISISFIILIPIIIFKPANIKLGIIKDLFEETSKTEINGPKQLRLIIFENLKNNGKVFNETQAQNIKNNSLNLILNETKKFYNDHSHKFAIYVPKKNIEFWELLKRNNLAYWCSSTGFVIPALSGIQLIKGVQDPKLCETYYVAGPSEYGKNSYLTNLNNLQICKYAKQKNIEYIYIFNSLYTSEKNNFINCNFIK